MSDDLQRALAAVAEPTRFRIIGLLAERPRTVSEVQEAIGARQPQTTKHLQVLDAAGVVVLHKLGRRRVARIDRATMRRLSDHFAALAAPGDDDATLERYELAIAAERIGDGTRAVALDRVVDAPVERVWAAWTDPARAATWWAPRHFTVEEAAIAPTPDAPVRLVLREGDGARYVSEGRVIEAAAPHRLVFTLAPVDTDGVRYFTARHTVVLSGDGPTTVGLTIDVTDVREGAAPMVAGLEPGWGQLLDALAGAVA
ncbi:SRPBCC domain-containing protein [Tsukamurella paurometabola]|uniref:Activator of Hsp90 ATPase homolog 1-like protein n=1 Tax=Tsukamurella paurometabola TaxID=2061 RepID=A0A3P8MAZ9_TSUPA|nr:SRPBCC domain-containing protein [Tsukamurella paurometabola]UEA84754.1 SRPBCC domain-containing protein [Tsukamurella paurometabola]VDR37336.1 Activator of Hsp90 ATPase homolog 1-like protein [Tsukamurella paurometabola]